MGTKIVDCRSFFLSAAECLDECKNEGEVYVNESVCVCVCVTEADLNNFTSSRPLVNNPKKF